MLSPKRTKFRKAHKGRIHGNAKGGTSLNFGSYGLAIWALSLGTMAHVSALRETSVMIAALIGAVFLRESFGFRRIILATVVVFGVIIMNITAPNY